MQTNNVVSGGKPKPIAKLIAQLSAQGVLLGIAIAHQHAGL
jgi:hypothetical protein